MTNRPNLLIRRATPADARAIAEIGVRSWQAAYRGILPAGFLAGLSVTAREIAWEYMLGADEAGNAPCWIAERDGTTIGYVASGPPRDDDVPLPAAEIYAIYVSPDEWRSGAGKALLTEAVGHWQALSVTTLVLWALEANLVGRAFYEALGWRTDGTRQQVDLGGFKAPEIRYRLNRAPSG
ncbi:MAG TPA: GNAT family N-acetyltransferase [Candidatus Limnocylindrales bacterium]